MRQIFTCTYCGIATIYENGIKFNIDRSRVKKNEHNTMSFNLQIRRSESPEPLELLWTRYIVCPACGHYTYIK